MLVTVERYREITNDQTTAASAVTARIEEATDELAELLDRPLAHGTHTETLRPASTGELWPRATPITDGGDCTVDGSALLAAAPFGAWSDIGGTDKVTVTYDGGWVERSANPDATNRLPIVIERDLAWAAYRLGQAPDPVLVGAPAGASSIRLGDAAITMSTGASLPTPNSHAGWWSARTLSYRYSPVSAA